MQGEVRISRRALLRTWIGAGCAAVLSGCATPSAPAAAPTIAPTATPAVVNTTGAGLAQLRVGVQQTISCAPLFIAADRGYFQEQGIDVSFVPFASGPDMLAPLSTGQIDVCNADPSAAFLNAAARGIDVRFVADGNHAASGHSGLALVVKKELVDSGAVKDVPDLRGRTMTAGAAKGGLNDAQVHLILQRYGLGDADLNLQYLAFGDMLPALSSGKLDAAFLIEQLAAVGAAQGILTRLRGEDELFPNAQNTVIMFSQRMAAAHADAGKRFILAYLRASRDFMDAFDHAVNKDAIVSILVNNTTVKDPRIYTTLVTPAFDRNGEMNERSMQDMQQWWIQNGYVQTPVDLGHTIDHTYIESAIAQLGRQ